MITRERIEEIRESLSEGCEERELCDLALSALDKHVIGERRLFAAMAMQGMLAGDDGSTCPVVVHCERSVQYADALIKELDKK